LVDAGLSLKRLKEILFDIDFPIQNIQAVVISHEHSDHIKGAGAVARHLGIPLYVNENTYAAGESRFGRIREINFENGTRLLCRILIEPFPYHTTVRIIPVF